MADDEHMVFIADMVITATGGTAAEKESVYGSAAAQSFLDDPSCMLLVAAKTEGSIPGAMALVLENSFKAPSGRAGPRIALVKTRPVALNGGNMRAAVASMSAQGPALEGLMACIKHLYAPMIAPTGQGARLGGVMAEFQAGLASELRLESGGGPGGMKEDDVESVHTPTDEFELWAELSARGSDPRAAAISDAFESVSKEWADLASLGDEDALELLERTEDAFDAAWKADPSKPYPQPRMVRLFQVCASSLGRCVHTKLSAIDVWTEPFGRAEVQLGWALRLCRRWQQATGTLSGQFWGGSWKGPMHSDAPIDALVKRLEEILSFRVMHDELCSLLSDQEQLELRMPELFRPFAHLPALATSEYNAPAWQAAVADHEKTMAPVELRIAEKLKTELNGFLLPALRAAVESNQSGGAAGPQAAQLLEGLQRFAGLLQRKNIQEALSSERSKLLQYANAFVGQQKDAFDAIRDANPNQAAGAPMPGAPAAFRTPGVVGRMISVSQLAAKAAVAKSAAQALEGVGGELANGCDDLTRQLSEFKTNEFKNWKEETEDALADGRTPLALQTTGKVMQIDFKGDQKLHVNYSGRLVMLLREVRCVARDSNSGHQLLLPSANCCPIFAVWATQATRRPRVRGPSEGDRGRQGGRGLLPAGRHTQAGRELLQRDREPDARAAEADAARRRQSL